MPDEDCPNPLWLGWVKEWLDLARERNSKGVTTYKHAYDSLKACPIAFTHPSELLKLKGFGPLLTGRLTDTLRSYCDEHGLPMPTIPKSKKRSRRFAAGQEEDPEEADGPPNPAKKARRKRKEYVPAYRSGAYALVMALSSQDKDGPAGLPKADLIELAQPHCDASFTAPSHASKFYTAWKSMNTLLEKDLVCERGGKAFKRYALTDEGWNVALRVKQTEEERGAAGDLDFAAQLEVAVAPASLALPAAPRTGIQPESDDENEDSRAVPPAGRKTQSAFVELDGSPPTETFPLPTFPPMRVPSGSFDVHLVLDVREVRSKTDRDYMQEELTKKGIKPIMRSLELGDALWVAKCKDPDLLSRLGAEGDELVLDYIVERKRLDDLVASIKDGRFHEQKFRLRRSGVRNVTYIVEEAALDPQQLQRCEAMIESAMASTQVVNGYFLKRTAKIDETIAYLARMTRLLRKRYEAKALYVIPTRVLSPHNYLDLLAHLRGGDSQAGSSASALVASPGGQGASPRDHYISYPAFASLASKSEMLTLRDLFLKMLMCTKGITGEKALEIQKRWRTPREFVAAFEACGPGEEGRKKKQLMVFQHMGDLPGRMKMTKGFSQKLAEVWGDA